MRAIVGAQTFLSAFEISGSPSLNKLHSLQPPFRRHSMNRREFLLASAAGLALSTTAGYVAGAEDKKPLRVGLIGCGWYGKSDIFRLVQVAPVEIVSLCDVDKKMLEECSKWASDRQASHKTPRLYHDFREMLKE